ncbi:hypothetical protein VTK73DRAFT_3041 [Phialemonium thermophilum]|uniref:Major facilitator superfamily (MFS) profile domain-containing protein n=1 Tax=Phialemonium thermophilum TaxID=223376 RepID=A0ABR3VLL5_9PEZI
MSSSSLTEPKPAFSGDESDRTTASLPPTGAAASQDGPSPAAAADDDLVPTITNTGRVEMVNDKPVFKPTRDFVLAFLSLCMVALAIAFDATSLSVALPTISSDLGGTALQAFWSGTSFLLASTILQPTVASLSNIFGRKYVCFFFFFFFFLFFPS